MIIAETLRMKLWKLILLVVELLFILFQNFLNSRVVIGGKIIIT